MASLPPHLSQVAQRAWGRVSTARQVPPPLCLLETAVHGGREHGGVLGPSVTRLQEAEEHLPVSFNYGDTVSVLHGGEKYYGKEGKFPFLRADTKTYSKNRIVPLSPNGVILGKLHKPSGQTFFSPERAYSIIPNHSMVAFHIVL